MIFVKRYVFSRCGSFIYTFKIAVPTLLELKNMHSVNNTEKINTHISEASTQVIIPGLLSSLLSLSLT